HSSLDDHLARWFGLNQSKYQWALDDYYESKGLVSVYKLFLLLLHFLGKFFCFFRVMTGIFIILVLVLC
ncbi:hypothetical protein Gotri_012049, partial [Gossypium trilobum]|nr:hypothetical protein [Gossypium trilobum]